MTLFAPTSSKRALLKTQYVVLERGLAFAGGLTAYSSRPGVIERLAGAPESRELHAVQCKAAEGSTVSEIERGADAYSMSHSVLRSSLE